MVSPVLGRRGQLLVASLNQVIEKTTGKVTITFKKITFTKPDNVYFVLLSRDSTELQSLYSRLTLPWNKSMRKQMDAFSYTSLLTGSIMQYSQSSENCSIASLTRVACRMSYSLKIRHIGYILLKQTPLKTPETLKEMFA